MPTLDRILLKTVCSKPNQLEFYSSHSAGLRLEDTVTIHGRITSMQPIHPADSATDHLFVNTANDLAFTLFWCSNTNTVRTDKTFDNEADTIMRLSPFDERCRLDPSNRFLTLEKYQGVVSVWSLCRREKKRKAETLRGRPVTVYPAKVPEMRTRDSTFLYPRSAIDPSTLALLHRECKDRPTPYQVDGEAHSMRLSLFSIGYFDSDVPALTPGTAYDWEVGLGASHLIPVEGPTCECQRTSGHPHH